MDDSDNTHVPRRASVLALIAGATSALRGPKAAQIAGLTALRVAAAAGSLIAVSVIVHIFPTRESGQFFVFMAAAQFVAGSALGPLTLLALRFGSVHRANDDYEALGRLILFAAVAVGLVTGMVLLGHQFAPRMTDFVPGESWTFAVVAGLSGAMAFLGGLARVNSKVVGAILPENVLRPAGLGVAAIALWLAGIATFPALGAAYAVVLLAVCAILGVMAPWRATRFTLSGLEAFRPYLKAYGPLVATSMVATALSTFDIFLVSHAVSLTAVPAYKAAAQYSMLLTTGVVFANLIYGPQIAVAYEAEDNVALRGLAKASSRLALGFYTLALTPLLSGPWFFELAFGPVGNEAWTLTLILCAGKVANAWFGAVSIIAIMSGRTTLLALMQTIGVATLIIAGLLLAARYGSIGVTVASGLSTMTWVLGTVFLLQRNLKLKMGPI